MRRPAFRLAPHSLALGASALVTLAACASGGASSGTAPIEGANGAQRSIVRVDGGGASSYQTDLTHDDAAVQTELAAAPDRAYAALPAVYEQLGLPINTAVSDSRTIGVNGAHIRRVGKERMSQFLTCGQDAAGTPLADSYAITLTVMSRVTPSTTAGSLLSTQVLGSAQPIGTSGGSVTCQSTGQLEARIAKAAVTRSAS